MTPEQYNEEQENPAPDFNIWGKKKRRLPEHEN